VFALSRLVGVAIVSERAEQKRGVTVLGRSARAGRRHTKPLEPSLPAIIPIAIAKGHTAGIVERPVIDRTRRGYVYQQMMCVTESIDQNRFR
jgi:hypothetical protein